MARRAPVAAGGEVLKYAQLRRAHVAHTLRALARRRQSLLVAAAAFLGPFALALLEPIAHAMRAGVDPAAPFAHRLALIAAWIAVTTLVAMALREAAFMRASRPFLRTLPVSRSAHWRADVTGIALVYGLAWLQVAYAVVRIGVMLPRAEAAAACLALAGAMAIGLVMQSLLFQIAPLEWIAVTLAAALIWAAGSAAGAWGIAAGNAGAVALVVAYAWLRYERPHATRRRTPAPHRAYGISLGLATLRHEFGEAVGLRIATAALIALAGAALGPWDFCGKAWGVGVAQLAACALLLHRFPAMVHEHLAVHLAFLYRLRRVRVRAIAAAFGVSAVAFATSAAASAGSWRLACGALDAARWTLSLSLFGAVFVAISLASPRLRSGASSAFAAIALAVVALALATNA